MNVLTIVTTASGDVASVRLSKIAAWMGIPSGIVRLDSIDLVALRERLRVHSSGPIAITAYALLSLIQAGFANALTDRNADGTSRRILAFGFDGDQRLDAVLSWITQQTVFQAVVQRAQMTISFPAEGGGVSKQLAGTDFMARREIETVVFDLTGCNANVQAIVCADSLPLFIRTSATTAEIYALGGPELVDIDATVVNGGGIEPFCDRVLPSMMFLRACFGTFCWHSRQSVARLVIDDPLLSEKYGYLKYSSLFSSMERLKYAATIAFIPWNHWRTSRKVARRMLSSGTRLSICVHGCDHTNREFYGTDVASLGRKAKLAMDRMRRHAKRTDTTFDPIMVFPQGKFSVAAIEQLEATGFIAAANSTCFPWRDSAAHLTIGELLLPAVTHWQGFPIFQRQYPSQRFQCALSLFLGRPLILVEHHQCFRDGVGPIERCISELYSREPHLVFPSFRDLVVRSCLVRAVSDSVAEFQFFTRTFEFTTEDTSLSVVRLRKHEPDGRRVSAVLVNGRRVPFEIQGTYLCFEIPVSGMSGLIRVDVEVPASVKCHRGRRLDIVYESGVIARRLISELRDNVLCRNAVLLRVLRSLARWAGLTGDSSTR